MCAVHTGAFTIYVTRGLADSCTAGLLGTFGGVWDMTVQLLPYNGCVDSISFNWCSCDYGYTNVGFKSLMLCYVL